MTVETGANFFEAILTGVVSQLEKILKKDGEARNIENQVAAGAQAFIIARLCKEGSLGNETEYDSRGYSASFRSMWNRKDDTGETVATYTVRTMRNSSVESALEELYQTFLHEVSLDRAA